tara:strand:+ start:1498 stop:2679 length:1182 start_codon:yes stop_codon:yes gene_type:complete
MKKYSLSSNTWDSKEYIAIQRVIDSNLFTMGKEVSSFESKFAKFFGSKFCVMVNSGSSANLLMIASLFFTKIKNRKLKKGDEVIVPAVSWSTTYFPLQQYGIKLVFVDINKETLNFDIPQLEKAISKKTKAILAVNLLGNPNDFISLKKICKENGLTLLEDNCESMGAKYGDKYTGSFGLMGTFSSFFSHHISTMEGGYIVTDDEEIYHILLSLRAHGWTRNLPNKNRVTGRKSNKDFLESFNFVLPGYNLRPLEISAAIGKEQLKKFPYFLKTRRKNAKYFEKLFGQEQNLLIQKEVEKSSWFGFSIILQNKNISRNKLVSYLERNGVECRPIVSGNFTKFKKVLKYFDYRISGELKNSDYIDKKGFFVGNHHFSIEKNISNLKNLFESFKA